MALFNDTYIKSKISILSEAKKDGTIMNVKVPWSEGGFKNGNGRIYSTELLTREVSRIQKRIDDGALLGQADHPEKGNTELKSVSHIIRKMWMEKNIAWANIAILDTTRGKDLKTIIDAGGQLGVSSRGYGNINKKTGVVQDDYLLSNLDICTNPSFKAGTFSQQNVFESLSLTGKDDHDKFSKGAHSKDGYMRKNKLMEELKEDSQWSRVTKRMYEEEKDFSGTLEEYVDQYGLKIRAILAYQDGIYESYELAMIKLGGDEQDVADAHKEDHTPTKPAEPKDFYEESKITGIHPVKRAREVNEERARPADTEKRTALYAQVLQSFGVSATREKIDEAVDRILAANIKTEKPVPKVLSEAEKKKQKRLSIKKGMYTDGFLAGFKREQIDVAIAKKMAELNEEELMEV